MEEVAAAVAHQEAEPKMQHVMAHDIGHGEPVSDFMMLLSEINYYFSNFYYVSG